MKQPYSLWRMALNNFSLTHFGIKAILLTLTLHYNFPVLGSTQHTKENIMSVTTAFVGASLECYRSDNSAIEVINNYFADFETLAKSEKWEEIISQGTTALQAAKTIGRTNDEAKICAQLTSTAFYLGDYTLALKYASRCHELSEEFVDPFLFIRALYLESAVHRALAGKNDNEQAQQASYQLAVTTAEEAIQVYSKNAVDNENLKGKVYFNLGAAHADNPKGDLERAAYCYVIALDCFKSINAVDDIIRTSIRLGKLYLLQKKYDLSQKIINEVRPQISSERLAMHTGYLEAQLKFALNDSLNALRIANNGLARAKNLGAKEDELRLISLIESINKSTTLTNTTEVGRFLHKKTTATSSAARKPVVWPFIAVGSAILIGYIAMRIFKSRKN